MLNDNVYISPVLIVTMIFGIFAMAVMPPLGLLIIILGVNAQRRKLKGIRRARRAGTLSSQQRALEEQHRAWAGLPG